LAGLDVFGAYSLEDTADLLNEDSLELLRLKLSLHFIIRKDQVEDELTGFDALEYIINSQKRILSQFLKKFASAWQDKKHRSDCCLSI